MGSEQAERVDYATLLQEELKSSCMPEITDRGRASTEALVKDLHRVMTGNGSFTDGMIFKMASTAANLKVLQYDVNRVDQKVDSQISRCEHFQTELAVNKAVGEAEKDKLKKLGQVLWENKSLIFIIVLSALVYFHQLVMRNPSKIVLPVERINELIDAKIDQVVIGKPLPSHKK